MQSVNANQLLLHRITHTFLPYFSTWSLHQHTAEYINIKLQTIYDFRFFYTTV